MTTAEILQQLGRHDASADLWAVLVDRHGRRLWAVCRAVVGVHFADDAFQDGLITIRSRARRFRPGPDPEASALAWMVTVVHHASLDLLRRERRRTAREAQHMELRSTQSISRAAQPDLDRDEQHACETLEAMQALESLPERHRLVIRLRLLAGLESDAAASVLGCPVGQVRVRLHRALELLRSRLTTSNAALLPMTVLEESLRSAVTPPAALSSTALHCAVTAFTAPITTGITLGALMTISTVGISLVATLAVITTTVHAPGAGAVEIQAGTAPSAVAAGAAALESNDDLAKDLLDAGRATETVAYAIQHVAMIQGLSGQPDAIYQAALTSAAGDATLWHDAAAIIERYYTRETMLQMRAFMVSPTGKVYMRFQPKLQLAINAGAMQDSFQQVIRTTMTILTHPKTPIPPGPALDPTLSFGRCVSLASGYQVVVKFQIAESICRMNPTRSKLAVYTAMDRALEARPGWMDPLLTLYAAQLTQAQMEEVFAFFLTAAGREQAAMVPVVEQDFNVLLEAHFPHLIAATRALLTAHSAATAPAATPASF